MILTKMKSKQFAKNRFYSVATEYGRFNYFIISY